MTARRAPKTPASDMASVTPEKPTVPNALDPYTIGAWEPPSEADRARVRDGLTRNGAHDLADILGLAVPPAAVGPLAVPCPLCGAVAGASCRTTTARSRLVGGCHRARQQESA